MSFHSVATAIAISVMVALLPGQGFSQGADDWTRWGFATRCIATAEGTELSIIARGGVAGFDCTYITLDPTSGEPVTLIVPRVTRDAIADVAQMAGRWYFNGGLTHAPALRRAGDPGLTQQIAMSTALGGLPDVRIGPLDDVIEDVVAFLIMIDPAPVTDDGHGRESAVLGFYSPALKALVVDMGFVRDADGAVGAVPDAAYDTIAHELFHAISAGSPVASTPAAFVEEGLAEALGNLFAEDVLGFAAVPSRWSTRLDTHRYSRAPLMSVEDTDPYDTAAFWRYVIQDVHGRRFGPINDLLAGGYDLNSGTGGAAGVDAWLRASTGDGLFVHWRRFVGRLSGSVTGTPMIDQQVGCTQPVFTPDPDEPDRRFAYEHPGGADTAYMLDCLRLQLPAPGFERTMWVEGLDGNPYGEAVEIFMNGFEIRNQFFDIPPGEAQRELVVMPNDTSDPVEPVSIDRPGFRIVVEAPTRGCMGANDLADIPADLADRLRARSGMWGNLAVTEGENMIGAECFDNGIFVNDSAAPPHEFTYERGALVDRFHRLIPQPDVAEHTALQGHAETCGPRMVENDGTIRRAEDWVNDTAGPTDYFLVEDRASGACIGVAYMTDERIVIGLQPLFTTAGLEFWEGLLYVRSGAR